eukprot:CAMPEP_0119540338 /NCGR_PEP_ID=MMETSP1344-20130328/52263_1 /TAXON_ID=236787 /ORGANISM="Florenciella parvula, Strain CCMP2471" /LENGTH=36 /DNA_ID= /DNA_START= /DNA_END= /DNA_ORIENTATION=
MRVGGGVAPELPVCLCLAVCLPIGRVRRLASWDVVL